MNKADFLRVQAEQLALEKEFVGRVGVLGDAIPGFDVAVRITDVRTVFGRTDVRVTPISGHGDTWVNVNRVILKEGV